MAGEGTVLLDEIGTMPLPLQAKLLGVLEDRRFRRVGSEVERQAAARVIAATNTDLDREGAAGRFRQDLFFRLNVIRNDVPPLRAHLDDLPELCAHLLESIAGRPRALARGEIERLALYDWPGNVRELRNLLERAAILNLEGELTPSRLLHATPVAAGKSKLAPGAIPTLVDGERQHIERTLAQTGFNLSQTARALGISLSTLKRKVKKLGQRSSAIGHRLRLNHPALSDQTLPTSPSRDTTHAFADTCL